MRRTSPSEASARTCWQPDPGSACRTNNSRAGLLAGSLLYCGLSDVPDNADGNIMIQDSPEIRAVVTGVNRFGHLELATAEGGTLVCQLKELKFIEIES